ncbi:hypothetical protein JR065_07435 [Xanthomonas sp. AmX2]|uniref:cyclic GMP-AMP synthase DncV-like nucleotidyltransferase n=1 Tax=Xanthomonas sp. TaxID=29446 RepID=UPI00198079BB|nr:hypothetical protein [Xanthomonas sp.]MBN6150168.1 hypothetical protein [Xanthomonas sp.]
MSVFDCGSDMRKFHGDEVTLSSGERTAMRERRDTGRRRLEIGLDDEEHTQPKMMCTQGSYAMHTMVQDPDLDYDIDDGVYFDEAALVDQYGFPLTPLESKERVCAALSRDKRFANPAEVFPKCVRQAYHQGYHIDMPVYRIRKEDDGHGGTCEIFELAGDGTWDLSDARATTRWFKQQVSDRNGESAGEGDQMRRIIRLTKAYARSRSDWKDETTSGIVITKLVADHFVASTGRDDEALLETWKAIKAQLDWSTEVAHPVNTSKLAEAGNSKVRFFRDKLGWAIQQLAVLEDNCTRGEARKAWDEVFDINYFQKLPEPVQKAEASRAFFIAPETRSDVRNDGNGRFG